MRLTWQDTIAVLSCEQGDLLAAKQLASHLAIPLIESAELNQNVAQQFFLCWRDGCLSLVKPESISKSGVTVGIEHRPGEQRSWPMAKTGALVQALGRKTQTVVDATAGWGQDSLAMFRMGYQVTSIERNPVMAALLADGYRRLAEQDWVKLLQLPVPELINGDAIAVLQSLTEKPDCIYLDPMFPPKRKQSALAKKTIVTLRVLVGDDLDKDKLFAAALQNAGKRVVVKSPDYAEPLGGKPNESYVSKLVRYDVYLK